MGGQEYPAYPGREPRPDPQASAAYGEPVEELGKLRTALPWSSRGPHLAWETLEFMALYASRRRLGRLEARSNRAAVDTLVAADLMKADGAWNDAGLLVTDALRNTRASIEVDGGHGPTRTRMDIKVGNRTALAMAGPGVDDVLEGIGMSTTHRQLDIVGVEGVPALIAQWVGLGPAWSVGQAVEMDGSEFSQLLHRGGPGAGGPGAPSGFERFWDVPWFEWSIRVVAPQSADSMESGDGESGAENRSAAPRAGVEWRFVNAGKAGHFHYDYADRAVRLTPAPSFSVWMELLRAVDEVLTGQPAPADEEQGR